RYYEQQQKLRREFVSEITWPVIQFTFSIFILAMLIYVLGIIQPPKTATSSPVEPLGFGLLGASGALTFLAVVFGTIFTIWALWALVRRLTRRRAIVERFLLRVPLVGSCLNAILMTRFCIALRLMLETNVSVMKAMRLSLAATDNQLFVNAGPIV